MKLQAKLLLFFGSVLLTTFALVEIIGYQQTRDQMLEELRNNANEIRAIMMATRRVYLRQFISSGLPLNEKTLGFLPAHTMNTISNDFLSWSESGLTFNNVSDRPRNPVNQADELELKAMEYFRANPEKKERMVSFENVSGQSYYHFSAPIWIEKYCLQCHGERDTAPKTIREAYDTAYSYKLDELRGLMSIKLPTDHIEQAVFDLRLREVWGRLSAFLITFIFGAWLIHIFVTRRLVSLQSVAAAFAKGDYAARMPVKAQDELCDLAVTFNNMAEQRQRAEMELRRSEERWQFALEGSRDGVWDWNPVTNEIFFSKRWKEMLGYEDDEITNNFEEWDKRVHPDDKEQCYADLDKHLNGETQYYENEHRLQCKDGSYKWILDRGRIVSLTDDHQPLRFIGTHTDITERKQIERVLRRSQKMDAIGQLTGGIAHDFNNILGIIIGNLSLLEGQVAADVKALKRVESINKAAQRAADLTKQLLGFSRTHAEKTAITNLNTVIGEMDSLTARSITPEVEVKYQLAENLWLTEIDPGDFQDALFNLIINARDAMPNGGQLTMTTANIILDASYCESKPNVAPGDYVQLTVSDSGKGIPFEQLEHIFEPFFTTKEQDKGTGLGLAMVFGFIKRSGGHINVYSEEDIGTTFQLYLPRAKEQEQMDKAVSEQSWPLPGGQEIVLVVDDEEALLELARETLQTLGYRVLTATSGKQALEVMAEEPGIDLLFSDVIMPGGLNGYELAEQAVANNPQLKVLLTSGYNDKVTENNAQTRFTADLLLKPYALAELAQRVRQLL